MKLLTDGVLDLLPCHNLVLMDDKARFAGATSHDIRDHFSSWVADELTHQLVDPGVLDHQAILRKNPQEPGSHLAEHGTRYNYCLFVDDICLESVEHMRYPVVKILERQFGHLALEKRGFTVHPEWEDGETDDPDEDVGWMYMHVDSYVELYSTFHDSIFWPDYYARPPDMIDPYENMLPGSWRNNGQG